MRYLIPVFFLLLTINAPAQELFFSKPSYLKNLPSAETYDVFQDSKGFIWICTDAGLCLYKGNTLKIFTTKDSISENVVLRSYEDAKGRVWFSTLSGTFFYYENEQMHAIAANKLLKKYFLYFTPNSFFIGEQDTLYCSSILQSAILKIPPQHDYRDIIRFCSGLSEVNRFILTNKLRPGESTMGCGQTDVRLSDSTYGLRWNDRFLRIPFKKINHPAGNAWRGRSDDQGNIYLPFGKELVAIKKNSSICKRYFFEGNINSVTVDKDGDLWVCLQRGGGYLFKNADLETKPVHFLGVLSVSSVIVDHEGSVWASTLEKGIFRSNSKYVFYISSNDDKIEPAQKCSDQLIIPYGSKKIMHIYKDDSLSTTTILKNYLPERDPLTSIYVDSTYAYYSTGLALYYQPDKNKNNYLYLPQNFVSKFIIKALGDTILSSTSRNLYIIYQQHLLKAIFPSFSVNYLMKRKNGCILVGSRTEGIFELRKNALIPFLPKLLQLQTRINSITEDRVGNLWIATNDKGLYCFDASSKLHAFNEASGLKTSKINGLAVDKKNNIWAATNDGIIKIDASSAIDNGKITYFNRSHGLPDLQIERIYEFDDKIWCASKENLFYFNHELLNENNIAPLNHIQSIYINDQPISLRDSIVTSYDKNNIRIRPVVTSFKDPEKNSFSYMLIGYDKNWRSSSDGDLQYTNLNFGDYKLLIYGLNNDARKSNEPAVLKFTIEKPFWYTWWFILIELFILYVIVHLSLAIWKKRIEKKEQEKTSVNQRISEFKMTALRSQMNPHFIFNAIGSIQNYILKNETTQSYNYLGKFAHLIRNILNNSREEYISLSQEVSTLQLYIELEQIRFRPAFQFKIELDKELDTDVYIPTMLIQPYVENSIWHGFNSKKTNALLELIFQKEGDHIIVTIRDNGTGRKRKTENNTHISKGMTITEQRLQMLVSTSKTKFNAKIIDLTDENGFPVGTEVQLTIPYITD